MTVKMKISEIFYSIQGEGVNSGTPSVFLRLGMCNLHCWWCDTKYTWLFTEKLYDHVLKDMKRLGKQIPSDTRVYNQKKEIKEMTSEQVYEQITKYPTKHLVLTGGEPTLYHLDKELNKLLERLHNKGWYTEIETNGTIIPNDVFVNLIDQWNISPKLNSSGNEQKIREKPEVYNFYSRLPNAYFKFVIESKEDLTEVLRLIEQYKLSKDKIILMPQATKSYTLKQKSKSLLEICKENGFRFSSRLQIGILEGERGK